MARILLSSGEKLNVASDNGDVIGSTGVETVVIFDSAPFSVDGVKLDQNVERADVASASSAYKFQATGNVLKVFGADGKLVMQLPINTTGTQTVAFSDGSAVVKFETTGANAGKITVGGVAVAATVGGEVVSGASLNAAGASTHGPVVSTASTFSITAASASAPEGNTGTTNLSVTVSRTGDITKVASVTVATADGTATVGDSDYVAVNQVVSFAAGESSKTVAIAINGDTKVEADESFTVGLSNASPGDSINTASVALTITNDDQPIVNQTFVLTTGPDGFTGGDGDDQFIASNDTLSAADVLNGAAGNDTLRYASSAAAAVTESGFATSNIENIRVTSDATGGTTFDMTGVAGATMMANDNSSTNLSLTGVKNLMDLEVVNVSGGNTNVAYQAAVVAGSADTQKITVNNVASNAGTAVSSININGIETFAVTSTGSASQLANLTGSSLSKVTVAGAADLTVVGALTGVATLDATAFTGKLTATADANQSLNVIGGTSDDVFSVVNNLGSNDTINGGNGIDTLSVNNNQANLGTGSATITNFEQLGVTNAASGAINMDNFAGFSKVILDAGMNASTSISNAVTGLTVEVDVDVASTAPPAYNDLVNAATNLTVALKTDGAADTATILFDDVNNNDTIVATATTPGSNQMGTVTANKIETLNLNVDKLASGANQALTIAGLNADSAKTLNIESNAALTLAASTTPNLTMVDAHTSTGNLNLNALGLSTTGATVLGGSGNDTINAGTGTDTLTGGNGADNFTFEVGDSTAVATDTITDFKSGTDTLNLSSYGLTAANQFVGTFSNFGSAQGALIGGETPTPATYATVANNSVVFEANFDGANNGRLWIDNGDGTLDANDNRIILKNVSSVTATDLGLATGNPITLTGANALTNTTTKNTLATNQTSAGPDTINTTVANLAGSTVNGGGGVDKLVISDAITTANFSVDDGNQAAGLVQSVEEVTLAAGTTGVGSFTINGEFNKVTAGAASSITLGTTGRSVVGSTGADTISTTSAFLSTATVDGGAGTDTLALTAVTAAVVLNNGTTGGVLSNLEQVSLANGTGGNAVTIFNNPTGVSVATTTGAASIVNLGNGGQSFTGLVGNQIVSSDATVNGNDTITTGAGIDVVSVGGGNDNIQTGTGADVVNMNDVLGGVALTSADTVNGGGDAGDTLNITGPASAAGSDLTNVTGFTNLNIIANGTPSSYVTTDGLVGVGSLTVNMGAATAAVTFNGAAETTGTFSMQGSAFNDVLTGGALGDTFDGGAGNDTINAGAGDDVVNGSVGNDVVDLGAGDDAFLATSTVIGNATVTGGAGSDIFALTDLTVGVNAFQTGVITLADFALGAAGDQIYLDLADTDNSSSIVARDNFGNITLADDIAILATAQTTAQITSAAAAAMNGVVAVFNSSTGHGELWFDANWLDSAGRVQIASLDNMTSAAQLGGFSTSNGVDFILV